MQKSGLVAGRRANIAQTLVDEVRAMIVDGRLAEGERVNEVHLAARLGVSRTPLREALGRLAAEGALTSSPRIGYFVRLLTVEELEQIYPIRALLDPEALRLSGIPPGKRLRELEAANERIGRARNAAEVIRSDDAWHRLLVMDCPNAVLIALIEHFMLRTRRYELALMRERRHVRTAGDDHRRILDSLAAGDLARACEELRRNMENGIEPIAAWLRARRPVAKASPGSRRS